MEITFFVNQWKFREWLELNHNTATELIVGYYKVKSGKPTMTWSESVDQALCFGWIDGIRRKVDDESYCIRFTARKPNSIWSAINVEKVRALTVAGLMKPEGLKAFAYLDENKSKIYSYETRITELDLRYTQQLQNDALAWNFFNAQAPSYRKQIIDWIMSAKQEKTQQARLEKLILASRSQKRL